MKDSKGECAYCNQEITNSKAAKHFADCSKRLAVIKNSESKKASIETRYHLRIQDASDDRFWLDMEMRGSATLKHLDDYLRL